MLQAIAKFLLRLGGWTAVGGELDVPKAVIIAAPHTSNWDGVWALIYKVAVRLDVRWFAKESLFWFPLGALLRALGGIPLDRSRAGSAVDQAVGMFGHLHSFYFGPTLYPSGDTEEDLAIIRDFYEGIEGRWPLQTSPVRIAERGNDETKKEAGNEPGL